MKEVGKIYETENYGMFKIMKENRKLDESNIEVIKRSILEKGQLVPVIVGKDNQILDGQHRFEVCRDLGKPIIFIQIESDGISDVYTMNNVQKHWTLLDSLDSGVARGDEHYIKVKDVFEENSLTMSVVIKVLHKGRFSHGSGKKRRSANLCVADKFKFQQGYEVDIKNFEKNREKLRLFSEVFSYIQRNQDVTAGAFFNYIVNKEFYDHNRMLEQLQKYAPYAIEKYEFRDNVIGRVRLLTKIYNYKRHDKKVFHIEKIV